MFADLTSNEETFKGLRYIRSQSDKLMVGVGLSMGGNHMLRNAGEMPDFPLQAVVSVNNPFDIWLSINLMRGKVYEKHLANTLKKNLVIREPINDEESKVYAQMIKKFDLNMDVLRKVETWRDFDEEFTRKVHSGFPCCA